VELNEKQHTMCLINMLLPDLTDQTGGEYWCLVTETITLINFDMNGCF
jgi:hypothetical protein